MTAVTLPSGAGSAPRFAVDLNKLTDQIFKRQQPDESEPPPPAPPPQH